MKFKIFSIYEITYKAFVYFVVAGITILSIYYYFSLEDKSDTFIAATLYAMFLFVVGLYLSYMDKKIGDKIYERKTIYMNLWRVEDLLSGENLDFSTSQNTKIAIIAFRVLSGRSEEISNEEKKKAVFQTVSFNNLIEPDIQYRGWQNVKHHYIDENGFVFTPEIDKVEKEYLDLESELQNEITNSINEYIKINQIKLKICSFNELDLLGTNYEEWCDKYIDEDLERKEVVKRFIYGKIESLRVRLDILDIKRIEVEKYYKKCSKKTIWNIKKLEAVYGNKLQNIINSDNNIMQALNEIKSYLDEIQKEQANYNQIEDVGESVEECRAVANDIYLKLLDAEETIMAAIDVVQDDIGKIL